MPNSRTILVLSLDGACWKGLTPFIEQGHMPFLNLLLARSTYGDLKSVLPTFTYPNWASFWTGKNPSQHKVFAFEEIGGEGINGRMSGWDSLGIPTWIEAASENGLETTIIHAPLTWPPPRIKGRIVADQHMKDQETFTYPDTLAGELHSQLGTLHIPKFEQYFPKGGFKSSEEIRLFVDHQIASVQSTEETAYYLLKQYPWDIGCVHFFATDPLSHCLWHYVDQEHPMFTEEGHGAVARFFEALDASLQNIVSRFSPPNVMLFSYQGFRSTKKIVNLEKIVFDAETTFSKISRRFHRDAGSIYLDHKAIYAYGVEESRVQKVIRSLERLLDPETHSRVIRKAWKASDLYGPPDVPQLEVIIPEFEDGYTGRNGDRMGPVLSDVPQPNKDYLIGTHTNKGMWMFNQSSDPYPQRRDANIMDLASIILDRLSLSGPFSATSGLL